MITVYTSKTCSPCSSLKRYLDHKGVEYQTKDIDDPAYAQQVLDISGQLIVPLTVINDVPVVGLNYSKIASLLNGQV